MRAAAVSGRLQVTIEREREGGKKRERQIEGVAYKKKSRRFERMFSVLCFFLLLISTYETIFIFCPAS